MYKNRAESGRNNVCGQKIGMIRENSPEKISQRKLAELFRASGLDIDKNAVQRIETGKRFVTDIELKIIAKVLKVSYQELLDD